MMADITNDVRDINGSNKNGNNNKDVTDVKIMTAMLITRKHLVTEGRRCLIVSAAINFKHGEDKKSSSIKGKVLVLGANEGVGERTTAGIEAY